MRKRAIKWLGWAGAGLAGLAIVLVCVLATSPGQRMALGLVSYVASDADTQLEIGRLNGSLLGAGSIDAIVLRDRDGVWLSVRDIRFAWHPGQLLLGRVAIDQLVVASVHVLRQPLADTAPPDKSDGGGPSLLPVIARHVEVSEVVLDEPVVGKAVRLHVAASADLADASRGLAAKLAVARLDEPGSQLDAQFAYTAETDDVSVRIDGSEPAGGLVAHLLEFPNAPPLAVTVSGAGPRDRWRAEWALSASGNAFAAGTASVDKVAEGRKLETRFEGYLGHVIPAALAGILDGKTVGALSGTWSGKERFDVHALSLTSEAMQLNATGALDLSRSQFHGDATLQLARKDNAPVEVALGNDQSLTIERLAVQLSAPDAAERVVRADIDAAGIGGSFGSLSAFKVSATAAQANATGKTALDAERIAVVAQLDGLKSPTQTGDDATAIAAKLEMSGHATGGTLAIASLRGEAAGAVLNGSGEIKDGRFDGSAELQAADLSRFSDLAGSPLGGGVALRAKGSAVLSGTEMDLAVEGAGRDLKAGNDIADRVLAGVSRLTGRVVRRPSGDLEVDDASFTTAALNAQVRARSGRKGLALDARADVPDLAKVADDVTGAATLIIDLSGSSDDLVSKIALSGDGISVHGAKLTAPALSFAGRGPLSAHAGRLQLSGKLDGEPMAGTAMIAFGDSGLALQEVSLQIASATVRGDMRVPADANPNGRFTLAAPRLAELSRLAGIPLSGRADAQVELSEADGVAVLTARADVPELRVDKTKLKGMTATAKVVDYLHALRIDAKARLAALDSAQLTIRDLRLDAAPAGEGTSIKLAALINEFQAAVNAQASRRDDAYAVTLASASLRKEGLAAVIDQPASIAVDGSTVKISGLVIKTDTGRTEVAGHVAPDKIDLKVALKRLPAALANAFDRTLGLEGHIDGTVTVAGTTAKPKADAVLSWSGASAQVLRAQSLPALQIDARARLADNKVSGEVVAGGVTGLSIKATGGAGLADKAPLSAHVTGAIPLSLANGVLGERAASANGTARLEADISGILADPSVAGTVRLEEVSLNDPSSGLKLVRITGTAKFTKTDVTIESLQGASTRGGTFSTHGRVSQGSDGTFLTDIVLDIRGLKFDDQKLMSGELDGNFAVRGPLTALLARGNIDLKRLDVIVPSSMPQSITSLDIKHVNAPPDSRAARESAKADSQSAPPVHGRIDVQLNAASRIFVRGRGLDAQLGGSLHIRGTTDNPVADGAFVMERGRLTIVGRQLEFKRGRIYFNGSLEPQLDMEASADADGYTISVIISGAASKPSFTFASDPALPEDEAMARLLFNKSLAKLSPVQLAQLATEIDNIGGLSSGPSTLDKLKSAVGVDVLDVSTDDDKGPTVSAGSYINENTYVGVRQGTSASSSRVVIDHDFTKELKARGELGADGDSKIGVGVEWDY